MGKAFIEMRLKNKKYKLHANDIAKVYKINKLKIPTIPSFEEKFYILS
jgi:hypothetical protein